MTRQEELETKLARMRSFMVEAGYGAVLLTSDQNFAWLSCGGSDLVEHSNEMGRSFANILVTDDRAYLLANNIEMPRLLAEEVGGLDLEPVEYPWTEGGSDACTERILGRTREVGRKGRRAADTWVKGMTNERERIALLRPPLSAAELDRFRSLCADSADAMAATVDAIRRRMSEKEIQAVAGHEILARGAFPTLILVGCDERIARFRHPVPTSASLDRYCMVVLCAQRWGLVSSLTRLVHFGPLPDELRRRYDALLEVEHAVVAATAPGRSLAEVYAVGAQAYADAGFPEEEKKHFQGGTCGYYSREQELSPAVSYRIREGEVFAHNPSITGVKVEDTMLVSKGRYEVLTAMEGWPMIRHSREGHTLERPDILLR